MAKAIPRVQADIRMSMFDHVQRHSPHYFNERFAGSLANKITDYLSLGVIENEIQVNRKFNPRAIIRETRVCHFGLPFSERVL